MCRRDLLLPDVCRDAVHGLHLSLNGLADCFHKRGFCLRRVISEVTDVELPGRRFGPHKDLILRRVFPALVRARLWNGNVLLEPVLNGNAAATDIASGATVSLNLTDPDSMTKDLEGNIVFTSQADSELVFVGHVGTSEQTVGLLGITSTATGPGGAPITIDDTAFAPPAAAYLLVTDVGGGVIYRIDRAAFGFEPGQAYSASDTAGVVGTLNLDTGVLTPIVTGMSSARGLLFVKSGRHSGPD